MDQPTPSWRVFDAPSGSAAGAAAASPAGGATVAVGQQRLAIAGLVGALAIGGLAVVLALNSATGETIAGPATTSGTASDGSTAAGNGEIVIDVTGAVVAPGVYRLVDGSRVGDAIERAGEFSARVDANRVAAEINLAAVLTDGAQIRVPSRDDVPAPGGGTGGGGGAGGGGTAGGSGGSSSGLIDLNSASQSELESLPGIGPVTAGKILASRAELRFKSVDELRERGLVGEKTFEDLRALVTVG